MFEYSRNYYDKAKGWQETNPNWHTVLLEDITHSKHMEIIHWLYEHTSNPERHCRWYHFGDLSGYRFRYEKECAWFKLRWL